MGNLVCGQSQTQAERTPQEEPVMMSMTTMMTMTTSHVAYSCNILASAVGEDASILQQISSRWRRSQGEAAREGAEDKPWGTGKKTQAVRGDVAAGSMPMKQPESKQKKDDKNTRYTIKAAQPAAQAQPLAEKCSASCWQCWLQSWSSRPWQSRCSTNSKEGRL